MAAGLSVSADVVMCQCTEPWADWKDVSHGGNHYSCDDGTSSFCSQGVRCSAGVKFEKSLLNDVACIENAWRTHPTPDVQTLEDVMGYNTKASGDYSTAMGWSTNASGDFSTAMGYYTTASKFASTAMGDGTKASGYFSTAMGRNTKASGAASTAMGHNTTASGYFSTAMGRYTTASGAHSTAMGFVMTAESFAETVVGQFNALGGFPSTNHWVAADAAFRVGIGTNDANRKDALTVYKNGTVVISGDLVVAGSTVESNPGRRLAALEASAEKQQQLKAEIKELKAEHEQLKAEHEQLKAEHAHQLAEIKEELTQLAVALAKK